MTEDLLKLAGRIECEPVAVMEDGWSEWIHPLPGYLMQCCDCGLIHEMEVAIGRAQPGSVVRNEGETARRVVIFRMRRHENGPVPTWQDAPAAGLEQAIASFKAALPGWWFSVGECQVSCDASCGPTSESEHIAFVESGNVFDAGFHADLAQPSTLAAALENVKAQALAEIARVSLLQGEA